MKLPLPRISFRKARSTIPLLATLMVSILVARGVVLPEEAEMAVDEGSATISAVFDNGEALIAAVSALWIWLERRNPAKSIGLTDD